MTLSPQSLADLRTLCEKATPGPWTNISTASHDKTPQPRVYRAIPQPGWAQKLVATTAGAPSATLDEELADAALIAAARSALPALLDLVEEQAREIESLRLRASELEASMDAAQAAIVSECIEHIELNGHIDICKQLCDHLDYEAMATPDGDPSGKLRDFVTSLSIVVDQFDKQRHRANWNEAGYKAGKQKVVDHAVAKATEKMRPVYEAALRFPDAYGGGLVTPPGDWACKECKPHSDWPHIENGWRCPVHALLSAIAATPPQGDKGSE